ALINETDYMGVIDAQIAVLDANGKEVFSARNTLVAKNGPAPMLSAQPIINGKTGIYTVKATIKGGDDIALEATRSVFVSDLGDFNLRFWGVGLFDANPELVSLLAEVELDAMSFNDARFAAWPMVVSDPSALWADAMLEKTVQLLDYVKRGGRAIFLAPPAVGTENGNSLAAMPFTLKALDTSGIDTLSLHYAAKHPIFDELPDQGAFLGRYYGEIKANVSCQVEKIGKGYSVAGSVGRFSDFLGSDIIMVPFGRGQFIISTYQLKGKLQDEPLADRLLLNILNHIGATLEDIAPSTSSEISEESLKAFALLLREFAATQDEWNEDSEQLKNKAIKALIAGDGPAALKLITEALAPGSEAVE
ncbi:hypothetical protein ACFL1X_07285, partial [Candidatus Hydrogenedentota bacterium]